MQDFDSQEVKEWKEKFPGWTNGHHYGHEFRSADIAREWLEENRFDASVNKFVPVVALNHMKTHFLEKMKPAKKVKFARGIRREQWEDFLAVCNCDHPLTPVQYEVFATLREVLDSTPVTIPKGTKDPKEFVDNLYRIAFAKRTSQK